jgi:hypothetical protein
MQRLNARIRNWIVWIAVIVGIGSFMPVEAVPAADSKQGWSVILYEIAGESSLIEISPAGVKRISTPGWGSPPANADLHTNWSSNVMAISADRRLVAYGFSPSPGDPVAVFFSNLKTNKQFATTVPNLITVSQYARFNLGVFSPDGARFAFGYWDSVPESGSTGMIVVVDLVKSPGTVLNTYPIGMDLPVMVNWNDQGILFFPTCQACEGEPFGLLSLLDLGTGQFQETDQWFTQGIGDQLAGTGEVVTAIQDEAFAYLLDYMSSSGPNILVYSSQPLKSAARTAIYNNPGKLTMPRPVWVQGGQAVLLIDAHTPYAPYSTPRLSGGAPTVTLLLRSGQAVDLTFPDGSAFLAGTTEGWLLYRRQADGTGTILKAVYRNGKLQTANTGFKLNGPVVVVESRLWASTTQSGFTPIPDLDRYRLAACDSVAPISYLSAGIGGQVVGNPQPLYWEPATTQESGVTFSDFMITAGPICPDGNIWWRITTGDGVTGWTPELVGSQRIVRPTCPENTLLESLKIGERVTYRLVETRFGDGVLYSKPRGKGKPTGKIAENDIYTVLDGPACDGQYRWWLVEVNGRQGWIIQPERTGLG